MNDKVRKVIRYKVEITATQETTWGENVCRLKSKEPTAIKQKIDSRYDSAKEEVQFKEEWFPPEVVTKTSVDTYTAFEFQSEALDLSAVITAVVAASKPIVYFVPSENSIK